MVPIVAHLLNFALSFLFWLIIGRYVLKLMTGGRQTFVSDLLQKGTDPWFAAMRKITPRSISDRHIPILGLLMLINLRLFLLPFL
jgi:hypothetical protein